MKHLPDVISQSDVAKPLQQKLNAYALAAGAAGVAMLARSPQAEAKVVYTPTNTPIVHEVNLDLNNDGIVDFALCLSSIGFRSCHQPVENPPCGVGREEWEVSPAASNEIIATMQNQYAAPLQMGFVIGPRRVFSPGTLAMEFYTSCPPKGFHGVWGGKENRYLGFAFVIQGQTHYGWARVTATSAPMVMTGYAYETIPGQAIRAGQTSGDDNDAPYAGSLGVLALGAAGRK